ncbi:MAG: ABC transporter ATP-binding protein [Alphaproteobacteria bacterium]|nr:ABC transporter ATP-binding protein [Alphaproteobacteria bacterium]MDP6566564.1 ABC transporter ATP-binding protein [Alphaproteobacteria bacterium]MDP6813654.1 ABC transporter ATP-binding protein [Alphaproteobacteria bacterium]
MVMDETPEHGAGKGVPRLELSGISKRFPGCLANDGVDLTLWPGEIHALLGENGAGKSTLVKIIYGVLKADAGGLRWQGQPTTINSPFQARQLGIGMVFQHFSLFDSLTVAENVALGLDRAGSMAELRPRVREVGQRYGLELEPDRVVHDLSVGERQRVEIVRCLMQDPRLLIMDEPTSVLTPQEAERLFETLRRLAGEGCSILYISHKLEEIRALCDAATVMRGGRVVAACDPRRESAHGLARLMIGEDFATASRDGGVELGEARLVVGGLSAPAAVPHGMPIDDISFQVAAGEILGIAGVAGNGQNTLLSALSGERSTAPASAIRINGHDAAGLGPRERRRLGLAFVPEERLGHGSVPEMSLADNALLTGYEREGLLKTGQILFGRTRDFAQRIVQSFQVVGGGVAADAGSLSGGNLQKFIIGRELLQNPGLLVVAHPTWGVDAGAAAAIHQALLDLARQGAAILLVSQDLDELLQIADRIAVLSNGHLSQCFATAEVEVERIGLLMGGLGHAVQPDESRAV